jgi:hypothetical protein
MKRTRRLDQTGPLYKLEWYASIEDAARITRTDDRQWRLLEVSSHGYAPVPLPR